MARTWGTAAFDTKLPATGVSKLLTPSGAHILGMHPRRHRLDARTASGQHQSLQIPACRLPDSCRANQSMDSACIRRDRPG